MTWICQFWSCQTLLQIWKQAADPARIIKPGFPKNSQFCYGKYHFLSMISVLLIYFLESFFLITHFFRIYWLICYFMYVFIVLIVSKKQFVYKVKINRINNYASSALFLSAAFTQFFSVFCTQLQLQFLELFNQSVLYYVSIHTLLKS